MKNIKLLKETFSKHIKKLKKENSNDLVVNKLINLLKSGEENVNLAFELA